MLQHLLELTEELIEGLKRISGTDYHTLLSYRRLCGNAAKKTLAFAFYSTYLSSCSVPSSSRSPPFFRLPHFSAMGIGWRCCRRCGRSLDLPPNPSQDAPCSNRSVSLMLVFPGDTIVHAWIVICQRSSSKVGEAPLSGTVRDSEPHKESFGM